MKRFFSSLTFKISISIVLVEIIILTVTGIYYTTQFNNQVDQRIRAKVELPGELMDTHFLTTQAVKSKDTITQLVGEELIDGLAVSSVGLVAYALNPDDEGKNITELSGINPAWFKKDANQIIYEVTSDDVISVIPIHSIVNENEVSSFVYIKAGTAQAESEKQAIVLNFVIGSIATVFLTSISILVLFYFVISKRINGLLNMLRRVTSGDLGVRVEGATSSDQIGVLQSDVNTMADQLQQTIQTLEKQVAERTQGLETVVQISQRLTGILDLNDLLSQMVSLTKETFNYYHVHIYLLDEPKQTLVMAEGYGEAGAEMKRKGHHILLSAPQSVVARAAREGQSISVENTHEDPTWLPNPLLPETRSEMAVPVISEQEVIGVLDVQSEKVAGLTKQDAILLQALANQVAVAVRNARLFSQTQTALDQTQHLQRLYTGQAWERFSLMHATTDYEIRQPGLPPLQEIDIPEAITALQHNQTIDLRIGAMSDTSQKMPGNGAPDFNGLSSFADEEAQTGRPIPNGHDPLDFESANPIENALATPLRLGDEIIGVLGIRDDNPSRRWTEEEIALIEAVSEQMSLAIENARLFEETGRRASREKIIADVTRRIWASGEMEQVMRTTVEELGRTLDASKVIIHLGTEEQFITSPVSSNPDNEDEIGEV